MTETKKANNINQVTGALIKRYRLNMGITQKEFGDLLGVDKHHTLSECLLI